MEKINLVLLCGGDGRRLGKVNKPLLKICDKPILEILIEKFKGYNIFISCRNSNLDEYAEFSKKYKTKKCRDINIEVIIDEFENAGPSAGIYSALKTLKTLDTLYNKNSLVVVAADMPFVKREVVEYLYNVGIKLDVDALIPVWKDGKKEPLLAYYKISSETISAFESCIKNGKRRILHAVSKMKNVKFIDIDCIRQVDKNLTSFFNINTFEDLKRAEEICSSTGLVEE